MCERDGCAIRFGGCGCRSVAAALFICRSDRLFQRPHHTIAPGTVMRRVQQQGQQGTGFWSGALTRLFSSKSEEKGGGHSVPGACMCMRLWAALCLCLSVCLTCVFSIHPCACVRVCDRRAPGDRPGAEARAGDAAGGGVTRLDRIDRLKGLGSPIVVSTLPVLPPPTNPQHQKNAARLTAAEEARTLVYYNPGFGVLGALVGGVWDVGGCVAYRPANGLNGCFTRTHARTHAHARRH